MQDRTPKPPIRSRRFGAETLEPGVEIEHGLEVEMETRFGGKVTRRVGWISYRNIGLLAFISITGGVAVGLLIDHFTR